MKRTDPGCDPSLYEWGCKMPIGSCPKCKGKIGIAAGEAGTLNTLRDQYKIVEKTNKYLKLKRK